MSEYAISQIYPSDRRANTQINELLLAEGIRRDANLDYTCGMYDEEMNIIATGSCFGNTLRCMAVSNAHQGEGLMNQIVTHLISIQFERGNTHLFFIRNAIPPSFLVISVFMRLPELTVRLYLWRTEKPDLLLTLKNLRKKRNSLRCSGSSAAMIQQKPKSPHWS